MMGKIKKIKQAFFEVLVNKEAVSKGQFIVF
jgi:hypothetical protein